MADNETAPEVASDPVVPDAPDVGGEPTDEPSIADFVAEMDAADPGGEPEAPAAEPVAETPAEPVAAEPAKEPETSASDARKILLAAKAAEAKAAKAKQDAIADFKTDPAKFLAETGMTVEDFLVKVTGDATPAEPPKPEDRIGALEKKLADAEKAAAAREVADLKAGIVASVKADTAKFPRINRGGAHDLVTELMGEHYAVHGKPLAWEVAAANVEKYLASLSADEPAKPVPATPTPPVAAPKRPGTTTLGALGTRNTPPSDDDLPMDPDERLAAVLKQLPAN